MSPGDINHVNLEIRRELVMIVPLLHPRQREVRHGPALVIRRQWIWRRLWQIWHLILLSLLGFSSIVAFGFSLLEFMAVEWVIYLLLAEISMSIWRPKKWLWTSSSEQRRMSLDGHLISFINQNYFLSGCFYWFYDFALRTRIKGHLSEGCIRASTYIQQLRQISLFHETFWQEVL